MNGLSRKRYLELTEPTEEDCRSSWQRIKDALEETFREIESEQGKQSGVTASVQKKQPGSIEAGQEKQSGGIVSGCEKQSCTIEPALGFLQTLYPVCEDSAWKVTVSMVAVDNGWKAVRLEAGDTTKQHYGYCVDLGSTTVVMRLIDCARGRSLGQVSVNNRQIAWGADILTRIFYCKDHPERLKELTDATRASLAEAMEALRQKTGVGPEECLCMTMAGNAAMMHFFYGLDPFCVFASPYALRAGQVPAYSGKELGLPFSGMVYSYPARANYLGGDIVSGVLACGMDKADELGIFLDIGTNGELVIGNKEFLLCGAGAAGPALEGGVVKTGMRAEPGAVFGVKLENGSFQLQVIGGEAPRGICGSGIVDLLAELFLHGWVDIRGKFVPQASESIQWRQEEQEQAVEYAPGLWFYQSDITEFIRTKAAAHTMVEYLMGQVGLSMDHIGKFHVAGAFGTFLDKESAVAVGLYPDIERQRIVSEGNASLEGAQYWLLHRQAGQRIKEILEKMEYVQFAAVDDFLRMMTAAQALPHTDLERYPTVKQKLKL